MNKVRVIHNATQNEWWKPERVRGEENRSIMQEREEKRGGHSAKWDREKRTDRKYFEKVLFK